MNSIIEIYDNYCDLGIKNRVIKEGVEINLVREYIEYRKELFIPTSQNNMAIFIESQVADSYPDIVFVEYDPNNYEDWNETRKNLIKQDLKTLYHIYFRGGLDFNSLITELGISWKDAAISVEKLYDSGLIIRKDKQWVILNEEHIVTKKIEAFEAKLNHWDQVLQQSIINKNFASESYALSISKTKLKKEVLDKFKKFGIGVCLKEGNDFEVIKEAERSSIPVGFNSIMFNEWIGRILNCREERVNAI